MLYVLVVLSRPLNIYNLSLVIERDREPFKANDLIQEITVSTNIFLGQPNYRVSHAIPLRLL